ncbi:MAG: DUF4159 domain-containing protein [Anaerolineae bacterium]|nr:DUF4159 domain-containing protein [Anaerolineae bacterium]
MTQEKNLIDRIPVKRLHPRDGTAITAAVWEEAHTYHRGRQQLHDALGHGPGILTGLNVIASDPPDSTVYVLPGVAIAPNGDLIVVKRPVTFDFGAAEGTLSLWLTYTESPPSTESDPDSGERQYIYAQFGLEAQISDQDVDGVGLARIRRQSMQAPITDASNAARPKANEIDLRFRRSAGIPVQPHPLLAAVIRTEGGEPADHGAETLAQTLRFTGRTPLWIDHDVTLSSPLDGYDLVYLIAQTTVAPGKETLNALYTYLQGGGSLFIESCHTAGSDPAASEASLLDMLTSLGVQLHPIEAGHPLLTTPHCFAAPPEGATRSEVRILVGEGVIFSTGDYGCLWAGKGHGFTPTREAIRAAHEWGENLIHFAMAQRETLVSRD